MADIKKLKPPGIPKGTAATHYYLTNTRRTVGKRFLSLRTTDA